MLSFFLVAEALTGLIYHRTSGENSNFQFKQSLSEFKSCEHTHFDHLLCSATLLHFITIEYITSNKGGRKLVFENNIYIKQKIFSNGAVCWECEQRRTANTCKAKIHVLNGQVIHRVNEHTHNRNSATVEASKIRQQMKKRARETEEPPQQIIFVAVGLINDQARAGHQPEPQRRQYQNSNQRILNIVQDFNNRDIIDYLRGIAFNIGMKLLTSFKTAFLKATNKTAFLTLFDMDGP